MGESPGDYSVVVRTIAQGCTPALKHALERRLEKAAEQPARASRYGAECARLLLDGGLLSEAAGLCNALKRQFPDDPAGYVGLARVAMHQHAWTEALECWSEVSARFPQRNEYAWDFPRAQALVTLGRLDEAQELCRRLVEDHPSRPGGFVGQARIASQRCAWYEAGARWEEVLRRFPTHPPLSWLAESGRALLELNHLAKARQTYAELTRRYPAEPEGWVGLASIAMQAHEWSDARSHWSQALERCGSDAPVSWYSARGLALLELGLLEEADSDFRELVARSPTDPAGFVGLARTAMRAEAWDAALERWDEVLQRFADSCEPGWQASRAHVLLRLGYAEESEAACRSLVRSDPDSPLALNELARSLLELNRVEEALAALTSASPRCAGAPLVVDARLRTLIRLRRFEDARGECAALLQGAAHPDLLTVLLEIIPFIHEGQTRNQCWITLDERIRIAASQGNPGWSADLGTLRLRLLLARRDYDGFLQEMDAVPGLPDGGRHRHCLHSVAARLREPAMAHRAQPKVFGVGLSKTGTTSLAAALRALGFETLDWANPLTCELFSDDDLRLFDAFTDSPICVRFEQLYELFPNAKFVYTTRAIESWERSITDHFFRFNRFADFEEAKAAIEKPEALPQGRAHAAVLRSLYFRHTGFADAFRVYDRCVREFFSDKPTHRFLELDLFAGQGWPQLCSFLGCEPRSKPFPWVNRKARSRQQSSSVGEYGPR
jgi:predicted Zn-dependent protease